MHKYVFLAALFTGLFVAAIGQNAPLESYAGKYTFPQGSPVTAVEIKVQGEVLVASSEMGPATLQRIEADKFAIVEYSGLAEFTRNTEGKVIAVKVSVGDMVMEGTRDGLTIKHIRFAPLSPLRIR